MGTVTDIAADTASPRAVEQLDLRRMPLPEAVGRPAGNGEPEDAPDPSEPTTIHPMAVLTR